jgi:2-dehydro-3-deoxyphosphooctonate aldolase (KDO 8-P synthase)
MPSPRIEIAPGVAAGGGGPLLLIAGPDLLEGETHALRMAQALAALARSRGLPYVFKASFDKANRTSVEAPRGPGLERGLRILEKVKRELGVAVTTDFHEPAQAATVAEVVDLLQVPAFLCRQTDLLLAAGRTGRAVNVKKGQFLAPWDAEHLIAKVRAGGSRAVMVTERGTTFGYNNLVVDFRSLPRLRALGVPVCFDATHSVQLPGGLGAASGGEREHVADLARAAAAVGVDALFFEVHDAPERAPCDAASQLRLAEFAPLLDTVLRIDAAVRSARTGGEPDAS